MGWVVGRLFANKNDRWWLRRELVIPMLFQIVAFSLLAYLGGKNG